MKNPKKKKISFCITCMNRCFHLKETLKRNITENYLPQDIEFVLLDYNSSDHLEKWVQEEMSDYIDSGILVYFRTTTPIYYHRSHSRNIALRLSEGNIICNLDADNFLGEGFAAEMISEFSRNPEIFYTSNLSSNDIFGRVLMLRKDFNAVRGYNEQLEGYGFEDVDLYTRLSKRGLEQKVFSNPQYYNVIKHSKMDRISNERFVKNLNSIYISYIDPYTSDILYLYDDRKFEHGCFLDVRSKKLYKEFSGGTLTDNYSVDNRDTLLKEQLISGRWRELQNKIEFTVADKIFSFIKDSYYFRVGKQTYYKVTDYEFTIDLVLLLSTLRNIYQSNEVIKNNSTVNNDGFGRDVVYKNFDYKNKIILD